MWTDEPISFPLLVKRYSQQPAVAKAWTTFSKLETFNLLVNVFAYKLTIVQNFCKTAYCCPAAFVIINKYERKSFGNPSYSFMVR